MNNRRLVAVSISFDLIVDMTRRSFVITRKGTRCIRGIPSDAFCVGSFTNEMRQDGYLVFSHPSFEIVPEGQELPVFSVIHGAINVFENPILIFLDWVTATLIRFGHK